jgi:hypothetical protein
MSRTPAQQVRKQAPRRVSKPQDRDEGEARRAAEVVARGGSVAGWSFSTVSPTVQRQEAAKPKTEDEKYKEAAEAAGKAALKTPQGEALKKKVLADPLVKPVVDAVTSTPGLIATGAVLGGGVAALAATGKELPIQPPEIPLDKLRPGMSATVVWQGPVNAPTSVGLTLTFKEQGPKSKGGGKPAAEAYRAETARIRAEQAQFGRGAVAPGSKEAEEQRQSDEAIAYVVAQQTGRFGLTIPLTPPPAAEKKEEEQAPVQPAPASPSADVPAQAHVDDALASPGRPLDAGTRRSMEARFGHDFSRVRVHDDARASATADQLEAAAFTVGEDIAFASGRYDPAGPEGGRLLAHELAHVVQQSRSSTEAIHRDEAATATGTSAAPARRDYEEFVDEAIRFLDASRDNYRTVAQVAQAQAAAGAAQQPQQPPPAAGQQTAPQQGAAAQQAPAQGAPVQRVPAAAPPAAPGLSPDRLHRVLEGLLQTYEGARGIIDQQLAGDQTRAARLRTAYLDAASAARAAATSTGRVNIVIVAAPKEANDHFITNATTYARLYFSRVAPGDTNVQAQQIDSPDALFDLIETTQPDRMIRRIDIFCHGTIEPTHQIKFGATWFRIDQIEAVAAARAARGRTLQNQTRFDGSTTIELHACRLGAPSGDPGQTGMAVTHGEDFLRGFGGAVGGQRGQETVGYVQRWVPRRFEIPGVHSTSDVGTTGPRAREFDRIAVQTFDSVMVGSVELDSQLTDAERQGAAISRERKVEIMRNLFDAAGGAWLIGHQYSTATPQSADPVRDRPGARDTFTNEENWGHLVLRVRTPPPAAAGGTTP